MWSAYTEAEVKERVSRMEGMEASQGIHTPSWKEQPLI